MIILPQRLVRSRAAWLLLIVLITAGAASPPVFRSNVGQFTLLRPLDPAPATPLRTLDGGTANLGRYNGRVVLLNVWATWCTPCLTEMPALERLQAASDPRQLAIVTVSIDVDGAETVAPFVEAHQLTHLTVWLDPSLRLVSRDPARIASGTLPLWGLPITYVVDKNGRVAGYLVGAGQWDSPEARSFLEYFMHPSEEAR